MACPQLPKDENLELEAPACTLFATEFKAHMHEPTHCAQSRATLSTGLERRCAAQARVRRAACCRCALLSVSLACGLTAGQAHEFAPLL